MTEDTARKKLVEQTLSAKTLPEVEAAWQALREWMRSHPEEEGMRAGFEQLAQMKEIAEMLDVETEAPTHQVA